MIPVDQIRLGGPNAPLHKRGDCLRACFCSLLELPVDAIPCFHGYNWWNRYHAALADFSFYPLMVNTDGPLRGYWIADVASASYPDVRHAVVMEDDRIVHDPSPRKLPVEVEYPNEAIILVPFNPLRRVGDEAPMRQLPWEEE